jgi:hypothetical protein
LDPEFFPWSCGFEIESNSEFKESSTIEDSRRQLYIIIFIPGFLFLGRGELR